MNSSDAIGKEMKLLWSDYICSQEGANEVSSLFYVIALLSVFVFKCSSFFSCTASSQIRSHPSSSLHYSDFGIDAGS